MDGAKQKKNVECEEMFSFFFLSFAFISLIMFTLRRISPSAVPLPVGGFAETGVTSMLLLMLLLFSTLLGSHRIGDNGGNGVFSGNPFL